MIDSDILNAAERAFTLCPDCEKPNHWQEPGDSLLCHECEKEKA